MPEKKAKKKGKPGRPKRAGRLLRELPKPCEFAGGDVKALRKKLGRKVGFRKRISQADLAEVLGVARAAVRAWEGGRKRPSGSARRLMEVLDRFKDVRIALVQRYAAKRKTKKAKKS